MRVEIDSISRILQEVLQLGSQLEPVTGETPLLGSLPEFDSMAVVSVLTRIEEEFGIYIEDEEVSAEMFETVGSLLEFVRSRLETA